MPLDQNDNKAILAGFYPFGCFQEPGTKVNPILVHWNDGNRLQKFRLWAFDVTHGGGGSDSRAPDEFRIQITQGPENFEGIDADGYKDVLIGYSREEDVIVAYDRRWLERWIQKKLEGDRSSPSVQVKKAQIEAGAREGIYRVTKNANFGEGNIVIMKPELFPAFLNRSDDVLGGTVGVQEAKSALPNNAEDVWSYCRSQGFEFSPDLLARYIASLACKPFVILAGVSGTGKSKLAELVAEYYSRAASPSAASAPQTGETFSFGSSALKPNPERFALVAVRPNWSDNQSILGYVNPVTEEYESTQALDLILAADASLRASADPTTAPRFFMLLDEMNLARVEYYFSDWLACSESRRYSDDGSVVQQHVQLHRFEKTLHTSVRSGDGHLEKRPVPPSISLPTNLLVTGTVNVDETTHQFSAKVLDRAMVIDNDEVTLSGLRGLAKDGQTNHGYRFPESLPAFQLATSSDYRKIPLETHNHLVALNEILKGARLHFGYRSANEMALFMRIYNDLLPETSADPEWLSALDAALLQKVLPRLQGSRSRLEKALVFFCSYLRDLKTPEVGAALDESTFEELAAAKLPKSYREAVKILNMLREFGFASFFK